MKFSVITVCYIVGEVVATAVASVLSQSLPVWNIPSWTGIQRTGRWMSSLELLKSLICFVVRNGFRPQKSPVDRFQWSENGGRKIYLGFHCATDEVGLRMVRT